MFSYLWISVSLSQPKVYYVDVMLSFANTNKEVVWLYISMQEQPEEETKTRGFNIAESSSSAMMGNQGYGLVLPPPSNNDNINNIIGQQLKTYQDSKTNP